MSARYEVDLTREEKEQLLAVTSSGVSGVRRYKRAQTLLLAHRNRSAEQIAEQLRIGTSTVWRTKKAFVEEGVEAALEEKDRRGRPRKLSANEQALLVATACSKAPAGRSRWTLQLLAEQLVVATDHERVSAETVRRVLQDHQLKPWQKKMWCIPKFDGQFVARMEHILELYAQPYDPMFPLVNLDEAGKQLVCEVREPYPVAPGQPTRYDYEYRRAGVANLFVCFERHRAWRHVKVTERKTATDFAHLLKDIVDVHYPDAKKIRLVLDNLSTHTPASLYQAFEPPEACRIASRLEFHYTPPHASWLNMAEIVIGTLNKQCLDRRIGSFDMLCTEIEAWQNGCNQRQDSIRWDFDVHAARSKLKRAYPSRN